MYHITSRMEQTSKQTNERTECGNDATPFKPISLFDQSKQAVWPDLAKIRQFGKIIDIFGNIWGFIR